LVSGVVGGDEEIAVLEELVPGRASSIRSSSSLGGIERTKRRWLAAEILSPTSDPPVAHRSPLFFHSFCMSRNFCLRSRTTVSSSGPNVETMKTHEIEAPSGTWMKSHLGSHFTRTTPSQAREGYAVRAQQSSGTRSSRMGNVRPSRSQFARPAAFPSGSHSDRTTRKR